MSVRLPYLETSAATGQNVSRCIDLLLDMVMRRMEVAVDRAMLPSRNQRDKDKLHLQDISPPKRCSC